MNKPTNKQTEKRPTFPEIALPGRLADAHRVGNDVVEVQREHRVEEVHADLFSGFGVWVSGFGFWVSGFGFRVSGFGLRVSGLGFRVLGLGVANHDPVRAPDRVVGIAEISGRGVDEAVGRDVLRAQAVPP